MQDQIRKSTPSAAEILLIAALAAFFMLSAVDAAGAHSGVQALQISETSPAVDGR